MTANRLILVTGATGYVGGRLVPRLLRAGYRVRCMARDPSRLEGRGWEGAELVHGDLLDPTTLSPALQGVTDSFYLVHSMAAGTHFDELDRRAAFAFREAAARAGVGRIIYLGGLASEEEGLSPHMRSRVETGRILREGKVPVTELRASIVVGSGSLSFELVRYLTERLPLMVAPRWVTTLCQPIGIHEILEYLQASLEEPNAFGKIIEIGGSDVLTYREMMLEYARARGLWRRILIVPVLTPRLSSYWLGLVTPIPVKVARHLIESVRTQSVCSDPEALRIFPNVRRRSYRESLSSALAELNRHQVETSWTGALSSGARIDLPAVRLSDEEGLMTETRLLPVGASADRLFDVIACIGGSQGWYYANSLWRLRGILDRFAGGVGLRRGRRHPSRLHVGEALDFWRVEAWEEPRLIRLRAEMRLPGRAWLEFSVQPSGENACILSQKALFAPRGLSGFLYWYGLYPIHAILFSGMARAIAKRAEFAFKRSAAAAGS
jgi:uncharacterized protein YbjT (DUF2867 family)